MGFEEFLDLAPRTVTVETFASETGYGVVAYGEPVEVRARVQFGPMRIVTAQGEEVVSHARVYLGQAVGPKDRITLPVTAPNRQPPILRVEARDDETGSHHWVIFC